MSRHHPTLRGWIALVLAVFAILFFQAISPARYIQSGKGTFLVAPATTSVRIVGAVLVVVSSLSIVEAFKRGSRRDKILAGIAALLAIALLVEFLELIVLPVYHLSNASLVHLVALRLR